MIDLLPLIHRAMAELQQLSTESQNQSTTMAEAFKSQYTHFERGQYFLSSPGDMMLKVLRPDESFNRRYLSDGSYVVFSASSGCVCG